MGFARKLNRSVLRNADRLDQVVMGKAKTGNTNNPRMALAGNNPSAGKQVKQLQRRALRMTKHARLVVGLLIRAAGGDAPLVKIVDSK
jgi:hypothetical protein